MPAKFVVVDEASMLDTKLAAAVIAATEETANPRNRRRKPLPNPPNRRNRTNPRSFKPMKCLKKD